MKHILIALFMGLSVTYAQEITTEEKPAHCKCPENDCHFSTAPIGIMGDHVHHGGGFMGSYRYMNMHMHGNLSGSSPISNSDISDTYMNVPHGMHMNMHMFGIMYGASDNFTIMGMTMYNSNEMNLTHYMEDTEMDMDMDHSHHHHGSSTESFTTSSAGFGDFRLSGLYSWVSTEEMSVISQFGISLPTGSIDERGSSPMMADMKLPYAMQLGSGTLDAIFGSAFTYNFNPKIFMGSQFNMLYPINKNKLEYAWDTRMNFNMWYGYKLAENFSLSGAWKFQYIDGISGIDSELITTMAQAADTDNYGGTWSNLSFGANLYLPNGILSGVKIGAEYEIPIQQSVNGIQMAREKNIWLGIQYML